MTRLKRWFPVVAPILVVSSLVGAGAIKVWSSTDFLSANDLNSNFAHIHNTMVGSHGPRLVNSDVSSNAGIAVSKIAFGGLLPRSVGIISGSSASVTLPTSTAAWISLGGWSPVFNAASTGDYVFTFNSNPRTSNKWAGIANPVGTSAGAAPANGVDCTVTPTVGLLTTSMNVSCRRGLEDAGFVSIHTPVLVQIYDQTSP